eukprot:m.229242 g.229242  ORF g.229242 m.229242 type:complete len:255 (+) comp10858_c1_seq13:575-1339(+)
MAMSTNLAIDTYLAIVQAASDVGLLPAIFVVLLLLVTCSAVERPRMQQHIDMRMFRFGTQTSYTRRQACLRVLILSAGSNSVPIDIDSEIQAIMEARRKASLRDQIEVEVLRVATLNELAKAILRFKPDVVQFCGHGQRRKLMFVNKTDPFLSDPVSAEDAAVLLKGVSCVVLHCCHGHESADVMHQRGIPHVVFYDDRLHCATATEFATAFWTGMFEGHGVCKSFEMAKASARDTKYRLLSTGDEDLRHDHCF